MVTLGIMHDVRASDLILKMCGTTQIFIAEIHITNRQVPGRCNTEIGLNLRIQVSVNVEWWAIVYMDQEIVYCW